MHSRHPAPAHPTRSRRAPPLRSIAMALLLGAASPAFAALGPAAPHATLLPLLASFQGDRLSARARAQLDELIRGLQGSSVEVAVLVTSGTVGGNMAGRGSPGLNLARMAALRSYLAERGIESGRVFAEGGHETPQPEPRLEVQLLVRSGP